MVTQDFTLRPTVASIHEGNDPRLRAIPVASPTPRAIGDILRTNLGSRLGYHVRSRVWSVNGGPYPKRSRSRWISPSPIACRPRVFFRPTNTCLKMPEPGQCAAWGKDYAG